MKVPTMRLYKLNDTILRVQGNVPGFLSGIASNVLDAPLNAFLNLHGRIIATFRQHMISGNESLISVPSIAVDNLLKHLERYAKLSHVSISPLDINIFMNLDTVQPVWDLTGEVNTVSEEEFTLFRLEHNIPLMGIDYQADEFILNVHEYDYVSYTKGCFLGQEPVAKVHNRAQPSRKLIVAFEDQLSSEEAAKMTSKVIDPDSGRRKGFLFTRSLPHQ